MRVERALVCPLVSQEELVGYLVLGFARNARPAHDGRGRRGARGRPPARRRRSAPRACSRPSSAWSQELRELARYRSELIATISHELKTPLTAILGHAELIADRHPDLTSLDAIIRNAQRLNHLVANLLALLARSRAGARPYAAPSTSPSCCEASVDLLGIRAKQAGVGLSFTSVGIATRSSSSATPRSSRGSSTTWSTTP